MKLIEFALLKSEEFSLHDDFIINVTPVGQTIRTDSYYFSLSKGDTMEPIYDYVKRKISYYLQCAANRISTLKDGEGCFIPIEFYDEYIGGFKIIRRKNLFKIDFGYIYYLYSYGIIQDGGILTTNNVDDKEVDVIFSFEAPIDKILDSFFLTSS